MSVPKDDFQDKVIMKKKLIKGTNLMEYLKERNKTTPIGRYLEIFIFSDSGQHKLIFTFSDSGHLIFTFGDSDNKTSSSHSVTQVTQPHLHI